MALSEIEKLERRYAENPQGLTFAPLAEVHRKNGDVARALDLLRSGLELHPDYIPASIVLGRCHLDLGDLPAAGTAFNHVLGLDGENVIALKALADISERQHHFDQAERWLRTLLSVDRSNDEARAQLERIETARRDATAAPPPPALMEELQASIAPADEPTAGPEAAQPPGEAPAPVAEEPAALEPVAAEAWVSPVADEAVPLPLEDLEPALIADEASEPPPPGLQTEEPDLLEEPVEPLVGLIGRDLDEVEPGAGDFRVELSEDIVLRSGGGHEFQVPDAATELSDRMPLAVPSNPFGQEQATGFGGLEEPPAPPALVPEPPAAVATPEPGLEGSDAGRWPFMGQRPAEPEPVEPEPVETDSMVRAAVEPEPTAPAAAAAIDAPPVPPELPAEPAFPPVVARSPEPPAETPGPVVVSEPEPDLVVTETMAEVLLHQGHSAEALRVYRELEVRNAGDPRLLQKIAALEEESRTPSAEPTPPRRKYAASDTGGQPVRAFFQGLLAARPPAAPAAPPVARSVAASAPPESSGAPTRPAADALSLSSVFGEETTPLPPAVPAGGPAPAGVSFDEFYSPPGASAAPKPRAPDPKNDDLDQFHAWLQNLKR